MQVRVNSVKPLFISPMWIIFHQVLFIYSGPCKYDTFKAFLQLLFAFIYSFCFSQLLQDRGFTIFRQETLKHVFVNHQSSKKLNKIEVNEDHSFYSLDTLQQAQK
jgi:hypothetical protein